MPNQLKDIKVLLAEDAAVMRKIEVKLLKKIGFENIIEAKDGKDAINKLIVNPDTDLIISDWNMPNKSGLEFLVWVRHNKDFRHIPFIMATGQSDRSYTDEAFAKGVTCFVAKPFDEIEMTTKVNEALGIEDPKSADTVDDEKTITAEGKVRMKIAHLQITDHLVLGVVKHMIDSKEVTPEHFELELYRKPGWNPVQSDLEKGNIDAACVLAPIAMDLKSYGVPIKIVLFAHRNGSSFVRTTQGGYKKPFKEFFANRSFLIPHKMSVHHMLSHLFLTNLGLHPNMDKGDQYDVEFEIVPPIAMPKFLKENKQNCGFMVAEPVCTKAIAGGIADLQFRSGQLWKDHPCCVLAFRDEFIDSHEKAVFEITDLMVKAGKFIDENPDKAAKIAVKFMDPDGELGLKVPILKKVLTDPDGITTKDLYPEVKDLEIMQKYMFEQMGIGKMFDLKTLVDEKFAKAACTKRGRRKLSKLYKKVPRALITTGVKKEKVLKKPQAAVNKAVNKSNRTKPVKKSKDSPALLENLVDQLNSDIKELEEKKNLLEKDIKNQADWKRKAMAILNNTAILLYEAELDQEAVKLMKKILKLDPENTLVKENLSILEEDEL